jgi:hypothetical protein
LHLDLKYFKIKNQENFHPKKIFIIMAVYKQELSKKIRTKASYNRLELRKSPKSLSRRTSFRLKYSMCSHLAETRGHVHPLTAVKWVTISLRVPINFILGTEQKQRTTAHILTCIPWFLRVRFNLSLDDGYLM